MSRTSARAGASGAAGRVRDARTATHACTRTATPVLRDLASVDACTLLVYEFAGDTA